MKITLAELRCLIKEAIADTGDSFDPLSFLRRSRKVNYKPLPDSMRREYDAATTILSTASDTMSLEELIHSLETDENPIERSAADPRYAQIELAWIEHQHAQKA